MPQGIHVVTTYRMAGDVDTPERCRAFLDAHVLEAPKGPVFLPIQGHTAEVRMLAKGISQEQLRQERGVDGVATDGKGQLLAVITADCLPVALAGSGAIALVHAGWRGTAGGIVEEGVRALVALGEKPADIHATFGPCISGSRYQVGDEVRAAFLEGPLGKDGGHCFEADKEAGKWLLSLQKANALSLERCGVPREQIQRCDLCTFTDEERLFSYRREGPRMGHMATLMWHS